MAQIRINNRLRYLGDYLTKEEAAKAYDMASKELFGEFAYTNFPSEEHKQ